MWANVNVGAVPRAISGSSSRTNRIRGADRRVVVPGGNPERQVSQRRHADHQHLEVVRRMARTEEEIRLGTLGEVGDQGISAVGAPASNTAYFAGITRWFDFF